MDVPAGQKTEFHISSAIRSHGGANSRGKKPNPHPISCHSHQGPADGPDGFPYREVSLHCDPLPTGGRWTSSVRRVSGWWGKHSSGFINTKLSSLCIHHCHLFNPHWWTFIHFSLPVKRVCDSQKQSGRYVLCLLETREGSQAFPNWQASPPSQNGQLSMQQHSYLGSHFTLLLL